MELSLLDLEKMYLAELLVAIQRCVYFFKVLSFYEKTGILESVASWQLCRTARNLAAHDYDIEYAEIADHFNSLQALIPMLYMTAARFVIYCRETLNIEPQQADFSTEFMSIVKIKQADDSGIAK